MQSDSPTTSDVSNLALIPRTKGSPYTHSHFQTTALRLKPTFKYESFWSIGGEERSFQSKGNSLPKTGNQMHDELHSMIKVYIVSKLEKQTLFPDGIFTKAELQDVCKALEEEYGKTYLDSVIRPTEYKYCPYDKEWSVIWAIGDSMIEGQVGNESGVSQVEAQKIGTEGKRSLLARLLEGRAKSSSTE